MNKAFVREPEFDGRVYCPRCKSLGTPVRKELLDHHIKAEFRTNLGDSAWFCEFATCEVAYFDQFERSIAVVELKNPVYPKDATAAICACFGFNRGDLEADLLDGSPTRIRELLAKSKTDVARCHILAANGECCMQEVQRLYIRQTTGTGE